MQGVPDTQIGGGGGSVLPYPLCASLKQHFYVVTELHLTKCLSQKKGTYENNTETKLE